MMGTELACGAEQRRRRLRVRGPEGGREASSAPEAMAHLPESLPVRVEAGPSIWPRSGPTAYVGPSRARPLLLILGGSVSGAAIGARVGGGVRRERRFRPLRRGRQARPCALRLCAELSLLRHCCEKPIL